MGTIANFAGSLGTFILSTDQFIYRDPAKLRPVNFNFGSTTPDGRSEGCIGTNAPPYDGTGKTQYFETYQFLPAGQYYVSMIVTQAVDRTNSLSLNVDGVSIGTRNTYRATENADVWRLTAGTVWVNGTTSLKRITITTADTQAGNRYIGFNNVVFHKVS